MLTTTRLKRLPSSSSSSLSLSALKGTSSGSISTALEIIREKLDVPSETMLTTVEKAANYRLSASEAAILSGSTIRQSKRELMTLATLTGGDLEVTADGDIIYAYPKNFRNILSKRSLGQKFRDFKKKVYPILYKMIRLSVSAMLFTSLAIVTIAILVAMSSSSKGDSSDDDSKSRSRSMRSSSSSIHLNIFDFYSTTNSYMTGQGQSGNIKTNQIGFFDSFFSFVFGDGNPNQGRYQCIFINKYLHY